ncbi:MAG: protease inhibitor I42 family protein [Microthrixaceae bacterium]
MARIPTTNVRSVPARRRVRRGAALLLVPIVAAPLVLASCGDDSDSAKESTTTASTSTTAAAGDNGPTVTASGPVQLKVGGRATIELTANPTTGYQWEPAAAPDTAVFRIVSDTYQAPDTSRVGAAGTQKVVVEGVAPGSATLTLIYVRPWETGVPPAETATFPITVS